MVENYKQYFSELIVLENDVTSEMIINGWVLLDCDNGNPEVGSGYVWVFETREQARKHKKKQNSNSKNALLAGPWRLSDIGSFDLHYARIKACKFRAKKEK